MYNVGDWVIDRNLNRQVRILEIFNLWGITSYEVYDPFENKTYKILKDDIKDKKEYDINEFLYIITASRLKNDITKSMISTIGGSILPLPHQIYTVQRALSGKRIRYLLADEVGLGKTIEAGLIIKELIIRGLAQRILIISPKGLVNQWNIELKEKFNEEFKIIMPQDFETIKRLYGDGNIYTHFQKVISPMDTIKPLEKRHGWTNDEIDTYNAQRIESIVSAGWDLIVIDEAHRIAGSSSDVARYKMGKALSKASTYLLLLTATPHQGKTDGFLRLIRLLDESVFPDERAVVSSQVAPYMIRTEKREAIDSEGNKLFKKRYTKTIEIEWQNKHSIQKELYEKVTEYVAKGYNKAIREKKNYLGFLMILMQRLVTSSTRAIKVNIQKRIDYLKSNINSYNDISAESFYEDDTQEAVDKLICIKTTDTKKEIEELSNLLILAEKAENQYIDAKVEKLLDIIDDIKLKENKFKLIIFTEFVATQEYLKDILINYGYTVSLLNGSMDNDERIENVNLFKSQSDILISTEAGGEGLNLQFCHIVINYDLPWNPMRIEQRIGRVDRIGQEQDVYVYNFILAQTIEFRVRQILEEKLNIIFQELGIDKMGDILDSVESEMDFTDVYINSITNKKYSDYKIDKITSEIKEKAQKISSIKNLIKDDKVLDLNILNDINIHDFNMLLKKMFIYGQKLYKNDKILNLITLNELSLNDNYIRKLIYNIPAYNAEDIIPSITIRNCQNEKGYWSLWEININDLEKYTKIIPIFINEKGIIKILPAKFIWDRLINCEIDDIYYNGSKSINDDLMNEIFTKVMDATYNDFIELNKGYDKYLNQEIEKYNYAFSLKKDAAMNIGLTTVRNHRIKEIQKEELKFNEEMNRQKNIIPTLKLMTIVWLE